MNPVPRLLAGTKAGLFEPGSLTETEFGGGAITALAAGEIGTWALLDGRSLWHHREDSWEHVADSEDLAATSLLVRQAGPLVGTEQAHLLELQGPQLVPLESFDSVEGREKWYTPWGAPADTRSITENAGGNLFVNIHVGGVVRSTDGGLNWSPTIDIDADVHQVLADPQQPGVVLAPCARGLAVSRDAGDSWQIRTEGLQTSYCRAVAVAGGVTLLSSSSGPRGSQAAIYRSSNGSPFEKCREGLPEWFGDNIDTGCLAARGSSVAAGTSRGEVFLSEDAGITWRLLADGLPPITCLLFARP